MGSYEDQKTKSQCGHEWEDLPEGSVILDNISVFARCKKCGTYEGETEYERKTRGYGSL
jgi:hypothetical protein